MDTPPNGSRQLLAFCVALIGCCCCWSLGEAQLALPLPQGAAGEKFLDELSAHYLPAGYVQPNVSMVDVERLLQQKCQRANAALPAGEINATQLSADIQAGAVRLVQCLSGLANISVVLEEVERARPNGDLDLVFEKYCRRMPQARQCLTDFNAALLPCLTREERQHNAMMQRIMGKLLEFVCYKDGDQIALFIAEEGPECLEQHRDNIAACMQTHFGHYVPSQMNMSLAELPELVLGPRQCTELHEFEGCVVRHLETCGNITPSNIVESMFRYVRKESNCQEVIVRLARERSEQLVQRSGVASSWNGALATLAFTLATTIITV